MSRKIIVTEPFQAKHIDQMKSLTLDGYEIMHLPETHTNESWERLLKEAEVVVGQPPLELLQNPKESCPNLRFIQMTWAGTDKYTRGRLPFPSESILLANGSGVYGMIMSQYVVGMILTIMLNFKQYHNQQQQKRWQRCGSIQSLEKARVLIFGAGDIGTAVAKRLVGFEAYTIGVCRKLDKKRQYFNEVCTLEDAEHYLSGVDIVVGCIPNVEGTDGYLNRDRLSKMKQSAIIVNVGRGNFIDCTALDTLLCEGKLYGAGLDVTNPEPLPADHPLWTNPRCMITPHASGVTFGQLDETEDLLCELVCDNLQRYCEGKAIKNNVYNF